MPSASVLAAGLVIVDVLVGIFLGIAKVSLLQAALESLVSVVLMIAFVHVALRIRGAGARFNQTLSAMAGCDVLLGGALIPLVVLVNGGILPPIMFANFWLLLLVWIIVITAHILRHALAVSFASGLGLSIAYFFGQMAINMTLFAAEA